MMPLVTQYDSASIQNAITGWTATHAIGGTLIKITEGYKGSLEIFGPTGTRVGL